MHIIILWLFLTVNILISDVIWKETAVTFKATIFFSSLLVTLQTVTNFFSATMVLNTQQNQSLYNILDFITS